MDHLQANTAIPAKYASVEFRSRLEARWAVFMDEMNCKWLYEYEGFKLPTHWYLPDFYLPELKTWLEIKPYGLDAREQTKCEELSIVCAKRGERVIAMYGSIGWWINGGQSGGGLYFFGDGRDETYIPCVCPNCGRLGFEYDGRGARVCGPKCCGNDDKGYSSDDPCVVTACAKANGYRFW